MKAQFDKDLNLVEIDIKDCLEAIKIYCRVISPFAFT